jgi:hypothetical protein
MKKIIEKYDLSHVCGVNYVVAYPKWIEIFENLL